MAQIRNIVLKQVNSCVFKILVNQIKYHLFSNLKRQLDLFSNFHAPCIPFKCLSKVEPCSPTLYNVCHTAVALKIFCSLLNYAKNTYANHRKILICFSFHSLCFLAISRCKIFSSSLIYCRSTQIIANVYQFPIP